MSGIKDIMMKHEDDLAMATSYLVRLGMLESCDAHGTIYGGGAWDLDQTFYKQVMGDRKHGANGPVPWAAAMKPREYTDLLKEAYEEHCGEACFACEKNMSD
jgi:hypothetical protein